MTPELEPRHTEPRPRAETSGAGERQSRTPTVLLALCALLALLALLALSAREARSLDAFYRSQNRLPLWDMAGHGWGGVELLQALEEGAPLRFLDRLNRQDTWPFGYSLLLLPFLAAGGPSFAAATLLSTVLFALISALLLWAAWEIERTPAGIAGGLLAGLLFLAAPLHRLFAVLIMRETAGIAFTALALVLYLRARRAGSAWSYQLAGLSALALVFIKVNYALAWLLAVGVAELLDLPRERRSRLLRRAARILWPWPGASAGRTALAVALDAILVCALAGINVGVGIYALLVIATVVAAFRWWRDRPAVAERWRALPVAARQLALTFVLPLWIWCLSPDPIHPKTILGFLKNRATGPPLYSLDSLLYYPRALLQHFSTSPWIGGAVLLLALAGAVIAWRSREKGWRTLVVLAFLGLLLATAHPYKEPRFLATTAPFLMLLGALAAGRLFFGLGGLFRLGPRTGVAVGSLLTAGAVAGVVATAPPAAAQAERLAGDYKLYSSAPAFRRPLAVLGRWARGGELGSEGRERIALLGTFNELSDSLVRWSLVEESGFEGPEVVEPLSRFRADLAPEKVQEKVRRWIAEERPDRVFALRPLPGSSRYSSGDFAAYNAWQLAAIHALEGDPAWTLSRRRAFASIEIEILLFERRR